MPVLARPIPTAAEIAAAAAEVRNAPEWEPQFGGERLFVAGILDHVVGALKRWCADWARHAPAGVTAAADAGDETPRHRAREAVEWLLSDEYPSAHSPRFSFAEVCDNLNLDIDSARRRIFAQLDPAALRALAE